MGSTDERRIMPTESEKSEQEIFEHIVTTVVMDSMAAYKQNAKDKGKRLNEIKRVLDTFATGDRTEQHQKILILAVTLRLEQLKEQLWSMHLFNPEINELRKTISNTDMALYWLIHEYI